METMDGMDMDMGSMSMDLQVHFTCMAGPFFFPSSLTTSSSCGHMFFFFVAVILLGIGRHYFESYKTRYLLSMHSASSLPTSSSITSPTLCKKSQQQRRGKSHQKNVDSISSLLQKTYQASMSPSAHKTGTGTGTNCEVYDESTYRNLGSYGTYGTYGRYGSLNQEGGNHGDERRILEKQNGGREGQIGTEDGDTTRKSLGQISRKREAYNRADGDKEGKKEEQQEHEKKPLAEETMGLITYETDYIQNNSDLTRSIATTQMQKERGEDIGNEMRRDDHIGIGNGHDYLRGKDKDISAKDSIYIEINPPVEASLLDVKLSRKEKFHVTLHYLLGYILSLITMLLVMSFNGYILLGLLIGEGLGHFLMASDLYHNVFSQSHVH